MSENTPDILPKWTESGSMAGTYFEQLYRILSDPWDYEFSDYEREKYLLTFLSLPNERYEYALELGCSIGILTEILAERCNQLLAIDIVASALDLARKRCLRLDQVHFEQRDMVYEFPDGCFDLIVASEVGYYLSRVDMETLQKRIAAALLPHGHLVLVHYTGPTNYPHSGDAVHDFFLAKKGKLWHHVNASHQQTYRLDVLEKLTPSEIPSPMRMV